MLIAADERGVCVFVREHLCWPSLSYIFAYFVGIGLHIYLCVRFFWGREGRNDNIIRPNTKHKLEGN